MPGIICRAETLEKGSLDTFYGRCSPDNNSNSGSSNKKETTKGRAEGQAGKEELQGVQSDRCRHTNAPVILRRSPKYDDDDKQGYQTQNTY